MSRSVIPGLEAPDAALEADIRARLDRVEDALEKAVRRGLRPARRDVVVPDRGGRQAVPRRCSCCSPATSATRRIRG